ncbi:hypothetical protein ANCCEY_12923 [Ancylostoma ceylanicum]|uniref:Uncharacterized protein n=1 Tax=Ancylostoma ceylanicum TaxID=53326 RepID=A0A0D6LDK0_9BILA|nr:hypothetical protein ANCCEY_12923 [Ancylostoma ceylanicum]
MSNTAEMRMLRWACGLTRRDKMVSVYARRTWPYHLRRVSRNLSATGVMPNRSWVFLLRMRSARVTPVVHRNIFVSITFSRRSTSLVAGQHAAPYNATDRMTARYTFDLKRSEMFLSHDTPVIERHFNHAALTRATTSWARLPSAESIWDRIQEALVAVIKEKGIAVNVREGAAPHYGPRIDIIIRDSRGRYHLLARIQLDVELPERFDLAFISSALDSYLLKRRPMLDSVKESHDFSKEGNKMRPILIHRSVIGPAETFLAITESECGGYWPFWMSPNQVVVIPVSVASIPYAQVIQHQLAEADYEVLHRI